MARSALEGELRTNNQNIITERLRESRWRIDELVSKSEKQNDLIAATLVFNNGKSSKEIESMVSEGNFELASIEAKIPIDDQQNVMTISIGARQIQLIDGTLQEKIEKLISSQQVMMFQAAVAPDPTSAQDVGRSARFLRAARETSVKYYKITIVGELRNFTDLADKDDIQAIFLDESGSGVESFLYYKNESMTQRRNQPLPIMSRRLQDGPPPGVPLDKIINNGQMPNFEILEQLNAMGN